MAMLSQILTVTTLHAMSGVMANVEPPPLFQETASLHVSRNATPAELAQIELIVQPTFDALPKEGEGRVGPRGAHYIIYRFFTQSYGWKISGLESVGSKISTMTLAKFMDVEAEISFGKLSHVELLQDKAPSFAKALERHEIMHGFSLSDIAVLIAALHQLILDESKWILEKSYELAGHRAGDDLSEEEVWSVLSSYLLIVDYGTANSLTPEEHDLFKQTARDNPSEMPEIVELFRFVDEVFKSYRHKMSHHGISVPETYNYLAMEEMSRLMLEGFGLWQTGRCRAMKADLMIMSRPEGAGRVPIEAFHAHPRNYDSTAVFAFGESEQRLRDVGMLDETRPGNISVLVANFMQISSNCVSTSKFYSTCCVDECERIMQDLEAQVNTPAATADLLLASVKNLSSPTVDAPRDLDQALIDKLHSVANNHGGLVPLHSRLFWQWMHFAYPNECPFPQAVTTSSSTSANTSLAQWSDQEVLPLKEPSDDSRLQLVITPNICVGNFCVGEERQNITI